MLCWMKARSLGLQRRVGRTIDYRIGKELRSKSINTSGEQEDRLLIFDGSESHMSVSFLDYCDANGIQLLCMPIVHTLNHPMSDFSDRCNNITQTNTAKILHSIDYRLQLSKAQFFPALTNAHRQAFTETNITAAWARSGHFPFNPRFIIRQCRGITSQLVS